MSTKAKVISWILGAIFMVACVLFWDVTFDGTSSTKTPSATPAAEQTSTDYSL